MWYQLNIGLLVPDGSNTPAAIASRRRKVEQLFDQFRFFDVEYPGPDGQPVLEPTAVVRFEAAPPPAARRQQDRRAGRLGLRAGLRSPVVRGPGRGRPDRPQGRRVGVLRTGVLHPLRGELTWTGPR